MRSKNWIHFSVRCFCPGYAATVISSSALERNSDPESDASLSGKLWKQSSSPGAEPCFRRQFDRIFGQPTGSKELDALLVRLARRKDELLRVLERPEIPLHTNASENALRAWVIKRKISGSTMSADGRVARDVMLGLSNTCRELGLSFFAYLGDRLRLEGDPLRIPPLAALIRRTA